jgi:F-type H+-transporting ATPase subunit delta|tara:strand:+ start:1771 stop:2310 length:540 start_codon:yes stop_codon:yes gene_type:complete
MKNPRAARRYALALFNLAGETGSVEKVLDDLRRIRTLLDDSDELKAFVAHPTLTLDQQERGIRSIFEGRGSELTTRFLRFLAGRRRLAILASACDEYETLYLDAKNILRVSIEGAHALDARQVEEITKKLGEMYGKKIEADVTTEPALIGGFIVRVRDIVHDFSINGKLGRLRMQMCGA